MVAYGQAKRNKIHVFGFLRRELGKLNVWASGCCAPKATEVEKYLAEASSGT
jgi:hypothetical protein